MASTDSLWTRPALQKYRPVLYALTALAVGCTIYFVNESISSRGNTGKRNGLQRRPAVSRRRRRRTIPEAARAEDAPEQAEEQANPHEAPPFPWAVPNLDGRTEAASESSWVQEGPEDDDSKDGQSLLTLLYRIAEEQNRKDGYVHRGVQCNSCNENPIRGIRYRCINCTDYDLCEQCEAMQLHPKTHLFYKIRIPAPFIGVHKERQPVLYPGKPRAVTQDLRKDKLDRFGRETGLKTEEIEAIWEQFRCMAGTEWPGDPDHYHLAIDRTTFDKCFVPTSSYRHLPPSLVYDRVFSYYDTNDDGLIGFEEFVKGIASLKRKNFDERLRRIFRGYDLDGDGFIDRRDVLRMFRSYYTLTRDLTAEIVAGMQEDTDEGDARDIILGSQPLSSAFTGSIPRRESNRAGEGKIRNALGDDVEVDDIGAVDLRDPHTLFDLDELTAENAERALSTQTPHLARGVDVRNHAYSSDWSSVRSSLGVFGVVAFEECDGETEQRLRRTLHEKLAGDYLRRHLLRRKAVMMRRQRHSFVADSEEKPPPILDFPLEAGGMLADPRLHTKMSKDLAEVEASEQRFSAFQSELHDIVRDLNWPIENYDKFRDSLLKLIINGWSERALMQDLDGFDSDPSIVSDFVLALIDCLGRHAGEAIQEPQIKKEFKKVEPSTRSRSSSKVRFEDGVGGDDEEEARSVTSMSSKSRSANERWPGADLPEPESDVGREVIYQVKQEALMELLDPVFRLREDLALHALLTRKNRSRCRAQIEEAFLDDKSLIKTYRYLDWYQRRWREGDGTPSRLSYLYRDEALPYRQFVHDMEAGLRNNLTGAECPMCAKDGKTVFVRIGHSCVETGHSFGGKPAVGEKSHEQFTDPPENCPRCTREGRSSLIHSYYCPACGCPSPKLERMNAELRRIVSSNKKSSTDDQEESKEENNIKVPASVDPSPEHTGKEQERDQASSPPTTEATTAATTLSESQATETAQYPDMAVDLHSSVATFNEIDSTSFEAQIAAKEIDTLLEESGYSVRESPPPEPESSQTTNNIDPTGTTGQTVPDPTLPQNRPNNSLDDTNHSLPPPHPPPNSISILDAVKKDTAFLEKSDLGPCSSSDNKLDDGGSGSGGGVLTTSLCRFYATMDWLEDEDRERGGPGRINFAEFEEVMKGSKGAALGFLANWVEVEGF